MKTISLKIMLSIIVCSVVTAILLCVVSIEKSGAALEREAEQTLIFAAEKYANQFSTVFKNTEGMVDAIAANVSVTFEFPSLRSDPSYFDGYEIYLDKIIRETLENGETAHGLYFTFAPELTDTEREIWYAYGNDANGGRSENVGRIYADFVSSHRDFSLPPRPDMEYYFQPIQTRTGSWTGPYVDPDISLNMITYSKAVFSGDVLIGVAGADILTADTIDIVETMKIYDGSRAFLLDDKLDSLILSPKAEHSIFFKQRTDASMEEQLRGKISGTMNISASGSKSILAFSHLSNGWLLAIEQPAAEIYASIRMLSFVLLGFALLAIIITTAFAVVISRKFSKPLLTVGEQLKQIGSGDYTRPIPDSLKNRHDDMGDLAQAISSIQTAIAQEAQQNREKDVLLIYQSKQAKIGEMVANISHQWKQPLNNINLILLNLYDSYIYQELDEETFKETMDKIMKIVRSMWETIDDFTDFLKPTKKAIIFDAASSVELALELMEDSIKLHDITVLVNIDKGIKFNGFPNEFSHVLFNVLNNARDAIIEAKPARKEISIIGQISGEYAILEISNKGNFISEDELSLVFTPYFTTKGEKDGTGIGLYISKIIVEQRMDGKIELLNTGDGVCCRIKIKVIKEDNSNGA